MCAILDYEVGALQGVLAVALVGLRTGLFFTRC